MSLTSALIILVTVLVTTFISGIFGMAGGIIFMGAMIVHGTIQIFSSG